MSTIRIDEGSRASSTANKGYTILSPNGRPLSGHEPAERLSKEEIRGLLASAVRDQLDMDVDDFIRDYRAGRWPDPDGEPNIMYLISLYQLTL
jgi:hypothetical protein